MSDHSDPKPKGLTPKERLEGASAWRRPFVAEAIGREQALEGGALGLEGERMKLEGMRRTEAAAQASFEDQQKARWIAQSAESTGVNPSSLFNENGPIAPDHIIEREQITNLSFVTPQNRDAFQRALGGGAAPSTQPPVGMGSQAAGGGLPPPPGRAAPVLEPGTALFWSVGPNGPNFKQVMSPQQINAFMERTLGSETLAEGAKKISKSSGRTIAENPRDAMAWTAVSLGDGGVTFLNRATGQHSELVNAAAEQARIDKARREGQKELREGLDSVAKRVQENYGVMRDALGTMIPAGAGGETSEASTRLQSDLAKWLGETTTLMQGEYVGHQDIGRTVKLLQNWGSTLTTLAKEGNVGSLKEFFAAQANDPKATPQVRQVAANLLAVINRIPGPTGAAAPAEGNPDLDARNAQIMKDALSAPPQQ